MNPLDKPGTQFDWAGMNPNPTASKTKNGPVYRISFEVDQTTWQMFMDSETKGMIVAGRLFRTEDGGSEPADQPAAFADRKVPGKYDSVGQEKPGEHGKYWHKLIKRGTFNAPPVLAAIGSDEEFQEWIRKQPSCISKDSDWDEEKGEGRCEPAHVRRVSEGSGTGFKPDYFCVPLTHEEHQVQHQKGEVALLWESDRRPGPRLQADPTDVKWDEQNAPAWFEHQANRYRLEWACIALVNKLGYERRRDCPQVAVQAWATKFDIERYIPEIKE